MKRFLNLVVLTIIFASFSLSAQMHHGRMFDSELKAKLQEYHKVNVCPQWMTWREKLENSMSAEDLQKLKSLREEAQKTIAEKKECLENCRKENFNQDGDDSEKGKGKGKHGKGMKSGKHKCFETCGMGESKEYYAKQLKEILSRYENTVTEILADAKPYHEKWQTEKKAIIEEHISSKSDDDSPHKGKMKGKMDGTHNPKGKLFIGMLLMWNGSCDSNPEDLLELGTGLPTSNSSIKVNAYPNPFTDKATISFTLEQNSKVKLSVSNSSGEVVSKLVEGNLPAGEHNYEISAGNLTPGAYIYKLDVDGKIKTGKIVLNK